MIKLDQKYDRQDFIDFLQESFLQDYARDVRPVSTEGLSSIKKASSLGSNKSLDLQVFEFEYTGSANKRVTLTKEAFQIMKQSATFNALAVFYGGEDDWRFSFLTANPERTEKGKTTIAYSNPRRYSFFLGPNAKTNTPTKFLLTQGKIKDFEDLKSRFSIEVVNKEFYKEISKAFTKLVDGQLKLPFVQDKSQTSLEFAVRLIGRVIFCWFLREKKSEAGLALMPKELLSLEATSKYDDYYHAILEPIFFEVLNKPIKTRKDDFAKEPFSVVPYLNGGLFSPQDEDYYKRSNGDLQSQFHNTLVIPDSWFKDFFETLETYNFTIDENTSFDEELSIDPEMLGRIFENLLAEINPDTGESARKSTGSYYTPRTIVNYMVDESLLLYLKEQTKVDEKKLRAIISYDLDDDAEYPVKPEEREKIIEALEKIKILDPACGSGAFPIGALQKIVFILQQVDPDGQMWFKKQIENTPPEVRRVIEREFSHKNFDYIRKLGIIRENIYGVDIQPIATEISRLRCFLTLVVDERIQDSAENRGIEPLPNLEFKFVTANSLIGLPRTDQPQQSIFDDYQKIDELKKIRNDYFQADIFDREKLKTEFANKKLEIFKSLEKEQGWIGVAKAELTNKLTDWDPFSHKPTSWFEPEWMFGIKTGFDVVIANPPYVEFKNLHKSIKDTLKQYKTTRGKYDLYIPFIENAYHHMNEKGTSTFICPTRFMQRDYGKELRGFLAKNCDVIEIVDFSDYQVFDTAMNYTCILIFSKDKLGRNFSYKSIKGNEQVNDLNILLSKNTVEDTSRISVSNISVGKGKWIFHSIREQKLIDKLKAKGIPLKKLCVGIFQGIATGKDSIFILDEIKTSKFNFEKSLVIPILKGKDIHPYSVDWSRNYLIYPYNEDGKVIEEPVLKYEFPKTYQYLADNKEKLKGRSYFDNSNKKWYELWNQRNSKRFLVPKIITLDNASKNSFAFDSKGEFLGTTTTYSIILNDADLENYYYVLGLLNSSTLDKYHKLNTIPQAGGFYRYQALFIEDLPIFEGNTSKKKELTNLVRTILSMLGSMDSSDNPKNQNAVEELKKRIDHIVFELYGLTDDEIDIVERKNE